MNADYKSRKDAFKKKDLHRRLARWFDFLSEYEFTVHEKPGKDHIPPDFLSRYGNDTAPDEACGGGEIGLFAGNIGGDKMVVKDGQLEQRLIDVTGYLSEKPYKEYDEKARRIARKSTVQHVLSSVKLLRRTKRGLRVVLAKPGGVRVLKCFHNRIGH